jgi:hypothetical protein
LRAAGYEVRRHDDHFGPTTHDEVWLTEVAARGWVALSHNKAIRHTASQRDAAMRSGLALFMLIGKNHADYQANLIPTMPSIISFLDRHERPFIAHVTRPDAEFRIGTRAGHVGMKLTFEQWQKATGKGGRRTG